MPKSKWLKVVDAETPVSSAAKAALKSRFEVVAYYFPLAAKQWKDDPEYVHQLRTSARRFRAAADFFAPTLPPKRAKRLTKVIKQARKSAGEARDLDVYLMKYPPPADPAELLDDHTEAVQGEMADLPPAQILAIRKFLTKARKKAQRPIDSAWEKAKIKGWWKEAHKMFKRVRWRGTGQEPTLGEIAPQLLEPLVMEFFTTADRLDDSAQGLHQLRIDGKRLRYAMELAAGGFEKSFRKRLYPYLVEVQSALGKINDHAAAETLLKEWFAATADPEIHAVLDRAILEEQRQYEQEVAAFRQWWTPDKVTELRSQFDQYLPPQTN